MSTKKAKAKSTPKTKPKTAAAAKSKAGKLKPKAKARSKTTKVPAPPSNGTEAFTGENAGEAELPSISAQTSGKDMGRPRTESAKAATIHIREKPDKSAHTLCGGSHSPIWNTKGTKPLVSVGPQQASKGTCGRCRRVAAAREMV